MEKAFERRDEVMLYFLCVLVGCILGVSICVLFGKKPKEPTVCGFLNVFESDEPGENPYLFLDLDVTPQYISKQQLVTFKVSLK